MHAAESGTDSMGNKKGRAVCGNVNRIENGALWVSLTEKLYSAARKEYFLWKRTTRLETVLA